MKPSKPTKDPLDAIKTLRAEKVILDADLAKLYGVSTGRFNEAVARNASRFPEDFRFQLTESEWQAVRTDSPAKYPLGGGRQTLPWAYTEHGAIMAATILRSERAIQMSVFVVRAFIRMRNVLSDSASLATKLDKLEREVTSRLDSHETAIVELMRQFLTILNPESGGEAAEESAKREIGFHVKDSAERKAVRSKRAQ